MGVELVVSWLNGLLVYFSWCNCFQCQCVDCFVYQIIQCGIDYVVVCQWQFVGKGFVYYGGFEMYFVIVLYVCVGVWQVGFDQFVDGFSV